MTEYKHWCGNCQIRIYIQRHDGRILSWQDCPYVCEYAMAMRCSTETKVKWAVTGMAENKQFGISEQLDCSDCVNHGGDWDCDHVQCRKGTDTLDKDINVPISYSESPNNSTLQPTCNQLATDTISRAGVMDALNGIEISRNASWYEFYQKAITAVGTLPSAQQWIPCKTAFPEKENTRAIIQTNAGTVIIDGVYSGTDVYGHRVWRDKEGGLYWDDEIVAWMPIVIPEPWKGEQDG